MSLKEKVGTQYVYKKDNKWSFYDENNRPIGLEYPTIEKAIDALYKYIELVSNKEFQKTNKSN